MRMKNPRSGIFRKIVIIPFSVKDHKENKHGSGLKEELDFK
jgi:hypothetical protein